MFASEEYYQQERVTTDRNDKEDEFEAKMLNATIGKTVLDVGCRDGGFTIRIAESAKHAVGLGFSKEAISKAQPNRSRIEKISLSFLCADATC